MNKKIFLIIGMFLIISTITLASGKLYTFQVNSKYPNYKGEIKRIDNATITLPFFYGDKIIKQGITNNEGKVTFNLSDAEIRRIRRVYVSHNTLIPTYIDFDKNKEYQEINLSYSTYDVNLDFTIHELYELLGEKYMTNLSENNECKYLMNTSLEINGELIIKNCEVIFNSPRGWREVKVMKGGRFVMENSKLTSSNYPLEFIAYEDSKVEITNSEIERIDGWGGYNGDGFTIQTEDLIFKDNFVNGSLCLEAPNIKVSNIEVYSYEDNAVWIGAKNITIENSKIYGGDHDISINYNCDVNMINTPYNRAGAVIYGGNSLKKYWTLKLSFDRRLNRRRGDKIIVEDAKGNEVYSGVQGELTLLEHITWLEYDGENYEVFTEYYSPYTIILKYGNETTIKTINLDENKIIKI